MRGFLLSLAQGSVIGCLTPKVWVPIGGPQLEPQGIASRRWPGALGALKRKQILVHEIETIVVN